MKSREQMGKESGSGYTQNKKPYQTGKACMSTDRSRLDKCQQGKAHIQPCLHLSRSTLSHKDCIVMLSHQRNGCPAKKNALEEKGMSD